MDTGRDFLKIGVDYCLETLQRLDKFAVQNGKLYFEGSEITVNAKKPSHAKTVQEAIHRIVQEKENMIGTLRTASDTLKPQSGQKLQREVLDSFGSPDARPPPKDFSPLMNKVNHNTQQVLSPNGQSKEKQEHSAYRQSTSKVSKTMGGVTEQQSSHMVTAQSKQGREERAGLTMSQSITQLSPALLQSGDPEHMKAAMQQLKQENQDLKKKQERDTRMMLIEEVFRSVKGSAQKLNQDAMVNKLMERNAVLIDRLAAEMNARIGENESSLENIRIQNRPCRIADEYSALMSNAWLDAKEAMDKTSPEEKYEKIKNVFLAGILKHAQNKTIDFYDEMLEEMTTTMKTPFIKGAPQDAGAKPKRAPSARRKDGGQRERHQDRLPSYVMSGVSDYLREGADFVDIGPLVNSIKDSVLKTYGDDKKKTEDMMKDPRMHSYIEQTARLAWKMVVQRPSMEFDFSDVNKDYDSAKLDLALGSKPGKNATVKYYKYPSLFHGSKCLVKGVVFVE